MLACGICGALVVDGTASWLRRKPPPLPAREARDAHLLLHHSAAERMRAAFRAVLPHIPPEEREAAVLAFYRRLQSALDRVDREGVFGLEESLGSVAVYRLWIEANRIPERWRVSGPLASGQDLRSGSSAISRWRR